MKDKLNSFWCTHENLRHEHKVHWADGRTEEAFTCTDCGKKIVKKQGFKPKRKKVQVEKEVPKKPKKEIETLRESWEKMYAND